MGFAGGVSLEVVVKFLEGVVKLLEVVVVITGGGDNRRGCGCCVDLELVSSNSVMWDSAVVLVYVESLDTDLAV